MNFPSVSGKNWLFRKFDSSDVIKFIENHSLTEIVAKLLSIRKINIKDINNTQKIFNHRCKMNGLSTSAKWSMDLENQITT